MLYKFGERPPIYSRDGDIFIIRHNPGKLRLDECILYGEPTKELVHREDGYIYVVFDISMGCEMQYIYAHSDDRYIPKKDLDRYILDKLSDKTLEDFWFNPKEEIIITHHKYGKEEWDEHERKNIILLHTKPNKNGYILGSALMFPIWEIDEKGHVIDTATYTNILVDDSDPETIDFDITDPSGQLYCYADDFYNHLNSIYNFKKEVANG